MQDDATNWYADSAAGIANTLASRDESTNWYTDSASGVVEALSKRTANEKTNWYSDSASGIVESLAQDKRIEDTNWYTDSASGVVEALSHEGRSEGSASESDKTNWYSDSASGIIASLSKRSGLSNSEKQSYEEALRDWIYYDMRGKSLRESSERGKAFFEFTPVPRNDEVDRCHVPLELQERFNATDSDAERVSILNYYLWVTGREPKSAGELGFMPTFDKPGLTESNEVGYGYAPAGQHQYHCVDFVGDAIDIGKDRLNDFFLKHVIHCLGLLKWLSPQLTQKQPTSFLLGPAERRLLDGYPQTINTAPHVE
ncbi:hypothetical protein SLS60_005027 [Paraconiothyrium brasiliense]|uniref:Uncharacterized protein n=1 Tax=Paraconiothyrium brasiliense TaxID=300254 RepID=A0ABR3RG69_9PLEO